MSTLKGFNGSVKAGDSPSAVGEVKNYTIDQSADTVDTTTLASTGWAENASVLKRWSGSLTAHFDIGDTGQDEFRTAFAAGSAVALELYLGGETGEGNAEYNGDAIIESISISNDVAGIVEASISFTGSGALVETALTT